MELGIKLSYIEEIKDGMQKRYNNLKTDFKMDGNISDGKKKKSIIYAKEMMNHANKHYYEIKHLVENASKTNRVAKQVARTMLSIKRYKEKISEVCSNDYN